MYVSYEFIITSIKLVEIDLSLENSLSFTFYLPTYLRCVYSPCVCFFDGNSSWTPVDTVYISLCTAAFGAHYKVTFRLALKGETTTKLITISFYTNFVFP
jgi:hypothetical protein